MIRRPMEVICYIIKCWNARFTTLTINNPSPIIITSNMMLEAYSIYLFIETSWIMVCDLPWRIRV